jgi:hypothetical protein
VSLLADRSRRLLPALAERSRRLLPALADRSRRLLPAAWLGLLACIALVAAPASFAVLARADAGRVNGRIFQVEAWVSIGAALLLWLLERARARRAAAAGRGSVFSTEMVLLLGTLLATLLAAYGVQPMIEAARSGLPVPLGFGVLHAISVGLFGVKLLLVAALAWRAAAVQ